MVDTIHPVMSSIANTEFPKLLGGGFVGMMENFRRVGDVVRRYFGAMRWLYLQ